MNRKRVIYIGILFIITVIVSITTFSYAYLTRVDEQHGKLNMVVGDLNYTIESSDLSNNSITLSAGEGKEIEITIKANNEIDTKYQLYTNDVEDVTIGYLDEEGFNESTGTISKTGTKKIKVVLDNTSDTSKTITFGVQGGFEHNTITLASNRSSIPEGEGLCRTGIAYEFDYTGNVQEFTAKCAGIYRIETWGAQGGGDNNDIGGLGAYTKGNIELAKNTNLYIQVGQAGTYDWTNCNDSTYNGGSSGGCMTSFVGGSGGGSTDIRLSSGNWNDFDSLKSRIMVAAGGAGAIYYNNSYHYNGRPGGGLTGTAGVVINLGGPTSHGEAPYAKQTKYDNQYYFSGANRYNTLTSAENGKFGIAGKIYYNNELKDTGSSLYGALLSGGSGGYYGGASGVDTSSYGGTGSSGSSFISGYNGCDAIAESSTSGSITHTNQPNHYSGKVFTKAVMIDGAGCNWSTGSATNCGANQPQPDGTNATGHSGNGYARITYLGKKDCHLDEPQNFAYTGSIQEFTTTCAGTYKLEVWGAQGGSGDVAGGKGGYSYGNIQLNEEEKLNVVVGGAGSRGGNQQGATGGYNGGGNRTASSDACGSGGGATHISKQAGTYTTLASYQNASTASNYVLIVAGGGAGSQVGISGGAGGGTTGGKNSYGSGVAGSQTSGYAFGYGESAPGGGSGGGWYGGSNIAGGSGYVTNLTGGSTTAGQRSGNGYARITYIGD